MYSHPCLLSPPPMIRGGFKILLLFTAYDDSLSESRPLTTSLSVVPCSWVTKPTVVPLGRAVIHTLAGGS